MKRHRFFVGGHDLRLDQTVWVHAPELIKQWVSVLRMREDEELILFDDDREVLYKMTVIEQPHSVKLERITELQALRAPQHTYLFWSLLKKDNNELVLQKGTELGVTNFVPIVSERTIKKEFNSERASAIITEAAEQCGRIDIPHIREPLALRTVLSEYDCALKLVVCEQGGAVVAGDLATLRTAAPDQTIGVLIGPEGGWSDAERRLFNELQIPHLALSRFTLRAETACMVAASQVANLSF